MKFLRSAGFALFIAEFLTACPGPEGPTIPDQTVIGPPEAAGDHCPREAVSRFAQHDFAIADLDQGRSCVGFIEQDECVVALFRDCTDPSEIPRSWQGSIDKSKKISLIRTNESATGMPRPPTDCSGPLVIDPNAKIATWAKLSCHLPTNGTHGGFYFERMEENVPPYFHLDTSKRTTVLDNPPASRDQLPDFAVLRARNEIWALAATPNESAGLYVGPIGAARLNKAASYNIRRGKRIVVAPDERFVLIADGSKLLRIDLSTNTSTIANQTTDILDVAITTAGVLVGVVAGAQTSELRLLDATTLELIPSPRSFNKPLEHIIPYDEAMSSAIAVLLFRDDKATKLIGAALTDINVTPIDLPEPARAGVALPSLKKIGFISDTPSSSGYFTLSMVDGAVSEKIRLPGKRNDATPLSLESLYYNEESNLLFFGTNQRQIIPYDPEHDRPLLQQISDTEDGADVVRGDSSGRMFSLSTQSGLIDPLLQ